MKILRKISIKLRDKLKDWLGITDLATELNTLRGAVKIQKDISRELELKIRELECRTRLLPDMTEGGLDIGVNRHHQDWGVFCIQGSGTDYVKFVDLSGMNPMEIRDLVKHLESRGAIRAERMKFDTPMGLKDMLTDFRRR